MLGMFRKLVDLVTYVVFLVDLLSTLCFIEHPRHLLLCLLQLHLQQIAYSAYEGRV